MTKEQEQLQAIFTGLALVAIATREKVTHKTRSAMLREECMIEAESIGVHTANLWPREEK